MPTQEQLHRLVLKFERDYPKSLSARLKWWAHVLGIDRVRLFQLLGLSRTEAAETPQSDLPRIVESHEDRAEMVNEMLAQLLASSDYDMAALRTAIHRPVGPATREGGRIASRRGGITPLPYTPTPRSRDGILLNEIVAGGAFALPALMAYLADAETDAGHRGGGTD